MIDLMLDSDMTNRQRERAKIIKSAADSLLALLNDVLDLSKIEAGKLDLAETDFSVRSILASTESLLAVRANDKMVRVSYTVGDEVPSRLRGDPNRLRQILLNLGNNAVKFTEQGEVSIRADLREQLNGEVVLHFVVSDTGIGIPPDKLESIFGRFSQADTSTTKKYGGTGLGLAISSQLATAMGGNMWVESELGKGSTFHFTAPFRRVGEPQEFDPTSTQHIMATTDLRGTKVLLVEDNIFNQAVALETLKRWGCDVTVASNGREAVEAFDSKQFDVILMDLQMPEMDGFEATRIIRSKEIAERVPIIAQTAHAFAEYRDRCQEAGMDEHISKPITVSELLKVLARFASANRRAVTPVDIPSDKSGLNGPWNTDSRTFDYEALLERLGGDREALKEMMNLFSSHIPALVQDVRSAVIAEDWGRLAKLSHKLAGACATFGANALADVAREMERSAKNSQAMRIEALLSRMDLELRSLEKCVGRFEF
jgi:CheY-like chemotaxis protein/HPt (histidine-containing phosphotransfer) domain-containing protein